MVVAFVSLLFMSAVWVGEIFFVKDDLGRGDTAYGLFCPSGRWGWLLGALVLSPPGGRRRCRRAGPAAAAIQGAGSRAPDAVALLRFPPRLLLRRRLGHGVKNVMFRTPDPRPRP